MAILDHRLNKYKDYTVNDLVAASFPARRKLGAAAFYWRSLLVLSAGVRRAKAAKYAMGLSTVMDLP